MKQLRVRITKIIFSLVAIAFLIAPFQKASAQIAVTDAGTYSSIAGSTAAITGVIGLPGASSAAIQTVRASLSATCQSAIAAFNATQTVESVLDTTSNAAFGLINGGAEEATKITAKLARAQVAKGCAEVYVTALSAVPTPFVTLGQDLQREQDRYSKITTSLQQVITDLTAQQTASVKDILKAFMVKLVLNVSKNLTTEMVNKMVNKYKISDYLAYGDAVATQVYSMKYINENFSGDARQQMMVRSLLQSEKFPEKIKTVQSFANSKAQEYLGTACNVATPGIDANDQNYFLKCLAAYGAPESSSQYHYLNAIDQVNSTKAAANASTQAELAQSSGFAPPRNCAGSLAAQQQIDAQYDKAYQEKDIAVAVAARLKTALAAGKTTQAEYDKAQAAADQAIANANALGGQVTLDSEGKTSNSPIIDICDAIDSPAQFVATSINSFLEKHLVQDTDLKTDNLPFYATFLSDVASNFLTNILTGGKSTSQVLKEAGVGALNGAIIGVTQQGQGGTGTIPNPVGSVNIFASLVSNDNSRTTAVVPGQEYVLVMDFREIADENPYRVVISGLGTENHFITSDELSISQVQAFQFTATNTPFTIRAEFITRPVQGEVGDRTIGTYTQSFTISQVAGVTTVLPRGPMASIR